MDPETITISYLAMNTSGIAEELRSGKSFLVTKHGKVVAKLTPVVDLD
jgi:antitoxin (DNA-binding transcriptional repressor) of toxin-antitoxin stability system